MGDKFQMLKSSTKIAIIVAMIIIGLYVCLQIMIAREYNNGNVFYDFRIYKHGSIVASDSDLMDAFNSARPTFAFAGGNQIYDLPNHQFASTVIFMVSRDGTIWSYSLSGGP